MKKVGQKNITISLPEPLLREFRAYAASRKQSMTSLMAEAIQRVLSAPGEKKKQRFLSRIRNAPDRGTMGNISWTRNDLHER